MHRENIQSTYQKRYPVVSKRILRSIRASVRENPTLADVGWASDH